MGDSSLFLLLIGRAKYARVWAEIDPLSRNLRSSSRTKSHARTHTAR